MNRVDLEFDEDDYAAALFTACGLERLRGEAGEPHSASDRTVAAFTSRVRRLLADLPPDLRVDDLRALAGVNPEEL